MPTAVERGEPYTVFTATLLEWVFLQCRGRKSRQQETAGEMIQKVACLLAKHVDLYLDPQLHVKTSHVCHPSAGGLKAGINRSWGLESVSLINQSSQ